MTHPGPELREFALGHVRVAGRSAERGWRGGKAEVSSSGDQGDRGPVSRAQALTPVTAPRVPGTSLRLAIHRTAAVRILRQCNVSPNFGHL